MRPETLTQGPKAVPGGGPSATTPQTRGSGHRRPHSQVRSSESSWVVRGRGVPEVALGGAQKGVSLDEPRKHCASKFGFRD